MSCRWTRCACNVTWPRNRRRNLRKCRRMKQADQANQASKTHTHTHTTLIRNFNWLLRWPFQYKYKCMCVCVCICICASRLWLIYRIAHCLTFWRWCTFKEEQKERKSTREILARLLTIEKNHILCYVSVFGLKLAKCSSLTTQLGATVRSSHRIAMKIVMTCVNTYYTDKDSVKIGSSARRWGNGFNSV